MEIVITHPGDESPQPPGDDGMADQTTVNGLYWQEQMYNLQTQYGLDTKFAENAQKLRFLEGQIGAREMTFAKGGGLPTVLPLPAMMGRETGNP